MREASDTTKLRNAQSELKRLRSIAAGCDLIERKLLARAIAAEKDAQEWKARFDALLSKTTRLDEGR